jgi:hypothetical protein
MDVDCVGCIAWIELLCVIWMNVSLQWVEFGISLTWLIVLQLTDENHKGIYRAFAELNICHILLRDYTSCTYLRSHYLKCLLRFWTGAVPSSELYLEIILINYRCQYYRP